MHISYVVVLAAAAVQAADNQTAASPIANVSILNMLRAIKFRTENGFNKKLNKCKIESQS